MQQYDKAYSYSKIMIDSTTALEEKLLQNDVDSVRLEVCSSMELDQNLMRANHYILVDRTIKARISLATLEGLERLVRMDVRELVGITEDVFEIACKAFKKDRRFFLTVDCKEEQGHIVLRDYIKQYEAAEKIVLGCYYQELLVGVLMAARISDTEYETVLGAILPEWQSKGAGMSLYAYEFHKLKEMGVKTLYSRISTDNVSSLNLHISLSKGKINFVQPLDIYIKDRQSI
ncbi:MAG: GNAT family N-acetyltransferase [Lachnospiraceae bacterium]|nr:GNAT family N-acetyltransferase [Lachnospiraceae bacterium]